MNHINAGSAFVGLLGIHWGQFPEVWTVGSAPPITKSEAQSLVTDGQVVKGLSGMSCVAPAWAIIETLNHPNIKRFIEDQERLISEKQARGELPLYPTPE